MRKILHVIAHLRGGGAERQLSLLTRRSAEAGDENHVVCLFDDGAEDYHRSVFIHRLEGFMPFSMMDHIVRQVKPDIGVLWLPERVTFPGLLAFIRRGVPFISMERCAPSYRRHLFIRDRVKYLNHILADALVSNFSIDARRHPMLGMLARLKKSEVIRNGYVFEGPKVPLPPRSHLRVVTVARLDKQKNLGAVIRLASALKNRGQVVAFDIVGGGPEKQALEIMIDENEVQDEVTLHGAVFPWFHLVDTETVFLSTSHNEGMPNAVFEAMSQGMVTVTPYLSETRDILQHGQNTLNYKDDADLLDLFQGALHDRQIRDRVRTGGYTLLETLSVDAMFAQYDQLFQQIM